jgi:hypothetical protein
VTELEADLGFRVATADASTLTVGTIADSAEEAGTRLAAAFRQQNPGVDVRIREADAMSKPATIPRILRRFPAVTAVLGGTRLSHRDRGAYRLNRGGPTPRSRVKSGQVSAGASDMVDISSVRLQNAA